MSKEDKDKKKYLTCDGCHGNRVRPEMQNSGVYKIVACSKCKGKGGYWA